jgi:hypothetical protein
MKDLIDAMRRHASPSFTSLYETQVCNAQPLGGLCARTLLG